MKKVLIAFNFVLILLVSVFSLSCFDRTNKDGRPDDSIVYNVDSAIIVVDSSVKLWVYDAVGDSLIKKYIPENLSAEMVLKEINAKYCGGICVDYVKASQDTVFLKIDESAQLTQRMGTTGAFTYMSELIYSLTEVPSINFVAIDFEEGDHAVPGIYQRSDFKTGPN